MLGLLLYLYDECSDDCCMKESNVSQKKGSEVTSNAPVRLDREFALVPFEWSRCAGQAASTL